jgi:Cu-Zn family superoxide dismutase
MKSLKFGSLVLFSTLFLAKMNKLTTLNREKTLLCADQENTARAALCILHPNNSTTQGLVLFKQNNFDAPVVIKGKFTGLKSNAKHGFHIHQFGDLSDGCNTAGPHYNPTATSHGGPEDEERHIGDLGNILSDSEGNATYQREDKKISLMGVYSVIGRSCVVHADEDDLGKGNFPDSKTTGHSGARVACGVIALCDPNKQI